MTSLDFTEAQWDYITKREQEAYKRGYEYGVGAGRLEQIRFELEQAAFRRDAYDLLQSKLGKAS